MVCSEAVFTELAWRAWQGKRFPIDEIELSRPFVEPVMKNSDLALIVALAVVGVIASSNELYQIATEPTGEEPWNVTPGVAVVYARKSCDPNAPITEQTYYRLMLIIVTMILYFVKAGVSFINKMTAFNERLIKTLFFRVIE
mgnify:CR=1 FL=1